MYTFIVQFLDLLYWGQVQYFLVFFVLTWSVFLIKFVRSRFFRPPPLVPNEFGVSILVPVVDEKPEVWQEVLTSLRESCRGLKHQIVVISNGPAGIANGEYARAQGFEVLHLESADKRAAIARGARLARHEISVILDSDTRTGPDSIRILRDTFTSENIGGVTPLHRIADRDGLMRRISDWLEDLRFNVSVRGQSVGGAVACLPGRLFAIRTMLLKAAAPGLVNETFLDIRCIHGDDRSLTSWLLKHGYRTIFQPLSVVWTEAPASLRQFAAQRLRWARGSLRGTLMSRRWLPRYPYTAFTLIADVTLRWLFMVVLVEAILSWGHLLPRYHYIWARFPQAHSTPFVIAGVLLGFFASGLLRQMYHLVRFPKDIPYLPAFLFVTTFVLTPVQWIGDLTCWRNDWLTRQTGSSEAASATNALPDA
jgi:hyaluronan synthase